METAQLVREIVERQAAVEQYLHPLIRRVLPDGEQVAHAQFQQHRDLEAQLRKPEHLDTGSLEFASSVGTAASAPLEVPATVDC